MQEVPPEKGKQVLKILHSYKHSTSIFDDFIHYEKRQEEDEVRKPAQVESLFIFLITDLLFPVSEHGTQWGWWTQAR